MELGEDIMQRYGKKNVYENPDDAQYKVKSVLGSLGPKPGIDQLNDLKKYKI